MMMFSKCSVVATLAALALSFGAGAMSQSSQEQNKKSQKDILECPTEVQKLCDQFQQVDVDQPCGQTDISQQCDQTDENQASCSSSGSQGQSDQTDEDQASCSSSGPKAKCGACVTQISCTTQAGAVDQFAQQLHPKAQVSSWYGNKQYAGQHVTYQNWAGTHWNGVRLENAHFKRVISYGSTLDNVWVHGHFKHWKFDDSHITNSTFSGKFCDVDFRNTLLENVDFVKAKFEQKHLRRSNFDGATLRSVRFINSKLSGMTFHGALLEDVSFQCSSIGDLHCFAGAKVLGQDGKWHKVTSEQLHHLGAKISCGDGALINFTQLFHY